ALDLRVDGGPGRLRLEHLAAATREGAAFGSRRQVVLGMALGTGDELHADLAAGLSDAAARGLKRDSGQPVAGRGGTAATRARGAGAYESRKVLRARLREGCRSLRSAFASIWRTRSRVTSKSAPTSSSVRFERS